MTAVDPKAIRQRFQDLQNDRASWEPLWQEIRDYIAPDLGLFSGEDALSGSKRYSRVLDAEAADCADVLASGLFSGVSSPSRPWLRLTTLDPELDESSAVKQWLDEVQNLMMMLFTKAEVYNQLHQAYTELPVFGTACTLIKPHPEQVLNLQNLTCGEYWLATDPYGQVDTMYRRLSMSAKQMVQQWGFDAVSRPVQQAYDRNPYARFDVIHAIEPRWERDITKRDGLNKPYRSVYFEEATAHGKLLSEAGFDDFPVMAPRWSVTGSGAVYGRGPGAKALSSSKALQRLQLRLSTLVDYLSDPPVTYPQQFKGQLNRFRPGGRIPVAPNEAVSIRSAWDVRADPAAVQALIEARKEEIRRYFYATIFQMIAATQRSGRTATEIASLEQEKMMLLGPVLERLHKEMLDPLVSNTFNLMLEAGMVPPAPADLQGKSLNVEYISVLAKAQKNSAVDGINKTVAELGVLAQINPSVFDKLDTDKAIETIADMNGVPPSLIVSGEQVALIRQQRAQQQQQAQQAAALQQSASTMKDLGAAADSQGLQDVMQQIRSGESML